MMKSISLAVLLACFGSLFSQKLNVWKGGAAGQPQNWHCPKNWSDGHVPNEFSDVVIPDVSTASFALPVIEKGEAEVNSIEIESNAVLTIQTGAQLVIFNFENGPIDPARLILKGSILLFDENEPHFSTKNIAMKTPN